jgi:hypothetical protein
VSNKPLITVALASLFRKVRCKLHGHTGELPCPWPDCIEGFKYNEFDTQLLGAEAIKHSYYRRRWLSLNGSERYCWDYTNDTSWFSVNKLINEEISRLIPQKSLESTNLYHYTSIDGLFGIVTSNHLWLTDYEFLNDSSELNFSLEVADTSLEKFDTENYSNRVASLVPEWRKQLALTVPTCKIYVSSFSEDRDNLSLWRAYAPNGGISLGFRSDQFSLMLIPGSSLSRVLYLIKDQRLLIEIVTHLHLLSVEWDLEKAIADYDRKYELRKKFFSHTLLRHLAFIKDPSFADERELRVTYIEDQELFDREGLKKAKRRFRPRGRLIVPYVTSDENDAGSPLGMEMPSMRSFKLPIEEIVVCPQPDSRLVERSIKEFLVANDFGKTTVSSSAIPYRRM